ncbi:DUF1232 domain-containing protein [Pontibacillus yanchengensis]|uniref:DUF1232 domain-containing protein n=2 Tax=Pontibacillus yanchengensis TaxID=462910 RepID=A0A6I5A2L3_9BACI|nr:DUF1232 domain-containing protein [Pontibacillus yanchengensis]MYL35013.1 DUF1232 domain-containing protein [Pontibacillus yanchengensis]MYL55275.1 DUF1232 domain-containing protein [Pontibacillus yanchengensis]
MLRFWRRIRFLFNLKKSIPFLMEFFRSYEVDRNKKFFSALLIVGYVLFPFDLIPDFLGLIGFLDDVTVLTFVLQQIVKMAPQSLRDKYDVQVNK